MLSVRWMGKIIWAKHKSFHRRFFYLDWFQMVMHHTDANRADSWTNLDISYWFSRLWKILEMLAKQIIWLLHSAFSFIIKCVPKSSSCKNVWKLRQKKHRLNFNIVSKCPSQSESQSHIYSMCWVHVWHCSCMKRCCFLKTEQIEIESVKKVCPIKIIEKACGYFVRRIFRVR